MKFSMRRVSLLSFLLLCSVAGASATVMTSAGGALTATAALTGDLSATISIDLRGPILWEVFDPALLGFLIASDYGAVAPNAVLIGANGAITEFATLTFNTGAPAYSPDLSTLVLAFLISPVGGITDPALLAVVGNWVAEFALTGVAGDVDTGFILTYGLRSVVDTPEVPEPSTILLSLAGLGLLGLRRRFAAR
jgi:hypothetical protein